MHKTLTCLCLLFVFHSVPTSCLLVLRCWTNVNILSIYRIEESCLVCFNKSFLPNNYLPFWVKINLSLIWFMVFRLVILALKCGIKFCAVMCCFREQASNKTWFSPVHFWLSWNPWQRNLLWSSVNLSFRTKSILLDCTSGYCRIFGTWSTFWLLQLIKVSEIAEIYNEEEKSIRF